MVRVEDGVLVEGDSPVGDGRYYGVAIRARLDAEPVADATVVFWVIGRPRRHVNETARRWLDGNRGSMAAVLERCRRNLQGGAK